MAPKSRLDKALSFPQGLRLGIRHVVTHVIFAPLLFAMVSIPSVGAGKTAKVMPTVAQSNRELIVLAAPITSDPYYADVRDEIFKFQVNYAQKVAEHGDDVLLLVDDQAYERYVEALGNEKVAPMRMLDIWMRDFSLSNPARPLLFRYSPEGQGGGKKGKRDAKAVQQTLAATFTDAGLDFIETDLINDGGNFVDDSQGNVVIGRKFLRDNNISESSARAILAKLIGAEHVAFIESDEQGGLEHADGVVAFVDTNTLMINSYPSDPAYAKALRADLKAGLPSVEIHEIVTPYDDSEIHDSRFGSACGLYTNALVTPHRIYFPQFGIPEDEIALAQITAATTRDVIPVQSNQVCTMGGGVRCMSWQLRGANAEKLMRYFE